MSNGSKVRGGEQQSQPAQETLLRHPDINPPPCEGDAELSIETLNFLWRCGHFITRYTPYLLHDRYE